MVKYIFFGGWGGGGWGGGGWGGGGGGVEEFNIIVLP